MGATASARTRSHSEKEYQLMATELDSMVKEYDQQSLMMSEELKKAKEQDIVDMNNQCKTIN